MTEAEPNRPPPGPPAGYDALGEAKRLLRVTRAATLATIDRPAGYPLATLTTIATDVDGSPILLLSQLSAHTRNLEADPRASLLLAQGGKGDPLAHPRVTIAGRLAKQTDPEARAALKTRFLRRNPKAALYADFADFSFWRMAVERAHLNGGFAKAADFDGKAVLTSLDGADGLLAAETGALDHLNRDHVEGLALYATRLGGEPEGRWRASGIDPDGIDLTAGDLTARVAFPHRATSAEDLRAILVALAAQARATK